MPDIQAFILIKNFLSHFIPCFEYIFGLRILTIRRFFIFSFFIFDKKFLMAEESASAGLADALSEGNYTNSFYIRRGYTKNELLITIFF